MSLKTAATISQALIKLEHELILSNSHLQIKRGILHELRLKLDEIERNLEYHVHLANEKKRGVQSIKTGFTNLGEEPHNES